MSGTIQNVALVYATRYGQTEKIMRYIQALLQPSGIHAELISVEDSSAQLSSSTNAVICGGPVYLSQFSPKLIRWVREHRGLLTSLPSAFFTVSLNKADSRPQARQADHELIHKFATLSGWSPALATSFAGAMKYRDYPWPVRILMRWIAKRAGGSTETSKNHEYTDWASVDAFVREWLAQHNALEPGPESRAVSG